MMLMMTFVACDQGQTIKGASDEFQSAVPFQVTPLGKATDQHREMDLYDYQVSIENNWKTSLFFSCSTPKIHSDYIVKRNPNTLNYMTMGTNGATNLSGRGVMGAGRAKELKQGDRLTFIVPMPVIPGHDQPGEFKIHMTFYIDSDLRQGRTMISEPVSFDPTG